MAARRKKGMFSGKVALIGLAALTLFLAYKVFAVSYEKYQITEQISNLDGELGALNAKSKDLQALIGRLKDKEFIEKEARKKLNLSKAGEKAVIIVNPQKNADTAKKQIVSTPPKISNLSRWFHTLFGGKASADSTAK